MLPVVLAEGLSKRYSRNASTHRFYGFSQLLQAVLHPGNSIHLRRDEFWAVHAVSFSIMPGTSLALIGANGSGKTTLLKMLAGLVTPDQGRVVVQGHVRPLINLGAGFNPRLSGLDNIRISASLAGFPNSESKAMVNRIVEFAELESFIDSPVEYYSSGMKARLGFSCAVAMKPDLLIIDEILSVGDQAFQEKSINRIHELREEGAAILLVTHSLERVATLCEQALWLSEGKLVQLGPAQEVMDAYLISMETRGKLELTKNLKGLREENQQRISAKMAAESPYGAIYSDFTQIDDLEVRLRANGAETDTFPPHSEVTIDYAFRLKKLTNDLNVSLVFFSELGRKYSAISTLNGDLLKNRASNLVRCQVRFPDFNFAPGKYVLLMPVHEGRSYLYRDVVKRFTITHEGSVTSAMILLKATWKLTEAEVVHFPSATPLQDRLKPLLNVEEARLGSNELYCRGWALSPRRGAMLEVWLNGTLLSSIPLTDERLEVLEQNPEYPEQSPGFHCWIPVRLTPGIQEYAIEFRLTEDHRHLVQQNLKLQNTVPVDLPVRGAISLLNKHDGRLYLRGWLLSPQPLETIQILCDKQFLGAAVLGFPRTDVEEHYPSYAHRNSGFEYRAPMNSFPASTLRDIVVRAIFVNGSTWETIYSDRRGL